MHTHTGLGAKDLLSQLDWSPAFQHTLLEYTASVFVQITQAANCVSAHSALQRLCRWLLSVDDHLQTGAIEISQDDLGLVLGVTRPVVARAMFDLQKADAIWFARGCLLLRHRARLEVSACECHSASGPGPRPPSRRTSSHLANTHSAAIVGRFGERGSLAIQDGATIDVGCLGASGRQRDRYID